jgi:prophage maintenance system killer protein
MRYLTLGEVVALHRAVVAATGGADGVRDLGGLESALAQPKATFDACCHGGIFGLERVGDRSFD